MRRPTSAGSRRDTPVRGDERLASSLRGGRHRPGQRRCCPGNGRRRALRRAARTCGRRKGRGPLAARSAERLRSNEWAPSSSIRESRAGVGVTRALAHEWPRCRSLRGRRGRRVREPRRRHATRVGERLPSSASSETRPPRSTFLRRFAGACRSTPSPAAAEPCSTSSSARSKRTTFIRSSTPSCPSRKAPDAFCKTRVRARAVRKGRDRLRPVSSDLGKTAVDEDLCAGDIRGVVGGERTATLAISDTSPTRPSGMAGEYCACSLSLPSCRAEAAQAWRVDRTGAEDVHTNLSAS